MDEPLFKIQDIDLKVPFKKQVKVEYSLKTTYAKPWQRQDWRTEKEGQNCKERK